MRRATLLGIIFFLAGWTAAAQEKYYLYIETGNGEMFEVRLAGQVYEATTDGHVIIPGLAAGDYLLQLEFALGKIPPQRFHLQIHGDAGFIFRQGDDRNWGLFGIAQPNVIMASGLIEKEITPDDAVQIPEPKPVVNRPPPQETAKTAAAGGVQRILDQPGPKGTDQVYTVLNEGHVDTVAIFIPLKGAPADTAVRKKQPDTLALVMAPHTIKANPCKLLATDEDFRNTRLAMAAAKNETQMMRAALASMKGKCYLVSQVRNLGVLFLSETSRYQFFQKVRTQVADMRNFASLSSQFTMPSLVKSFQN